MQWFIGGLTVACVLSLLGYFGRYFFLFEQIDSFRIQYFVVASIGLLTAFIFRYRLLAVTLLLVCLIHASELARFYLPVPASTSVPSLRVMSANLLAGNRELAPLLREIKTLAPDIVVFQEYTPRWHDDLAAALSAYPYRVFETVDSPFGIAAYSKLPYLHQKIDYFNQTLSPAVDISVKAGTATIRILGIHPIPPMNAATFARRNRYFDDVVTESAGTDEALVVMGDFNATPWSYHFKKMLNDAALKSSRDGFGLHPTWPGGFWPLWTPIDHIVHNEKVELIHFDSGNRIGSDHTPIWADLAVKAGK